MSTIHLQRLDPLASDASGQPTIVMVTDHQMLDLGTWGQCEYAPAQKVFVVWLHEALFGWRADELTRVFYHEAAHVRCGHLNKHAKHWHPQGLPRRQAPGVGPVAAYRLTAQREQEADQMAAQLRSMWPFAAYSLSRILAGRESYP